MLSYFSLSFRSLFPSLFSSLLRYESKSTEESILFGILASSLETVASPEQDNSGDDLEFSIATSNNQGNLGGISWFAIPFSLATSLGLASTALMLPITANNEAGDALVPAVVATIDDPDQGAVNMLAVWFPISAFVALGLENSVANMFIIPLGIANAGDFGYIGHQSGSELSQSQGPNLNGQASYFYLWGRDALFDYLENPFVQTFKGPLMPPVSTLVER